MSLPLHHQVVGEGPPLVVLHGLFGSGDNWKGFAKAFSGERQVWLLDLRNHGRSPHHPDMRYADLATDVLDWLEQHQIQHPVLLGHSMGGKTAMALALAYPERVERLIVADIAPVSYRHQSEHSQLIQSLKALPLEPELTRSEADRLLAEAIPEWSIRTFLLKNLAPGPSGLHWRIPLDLLQQALPDVLEFPLAGLFCKPTLFVGGSRSNYLLPEYQQEIHNRFTQVRIVMLKDAGHWLHAEKPEAFQETVRTFLQRTA